MSQYRAFWLQVSLVWSAITLSWIGDAVFDHTPGAFTLTEAYIVTAIAVLNWFAYFGSKS